LGWYLFFVLSEILLLTLKQAMFSPSLRHPPSLNPTPSKRLIKKALFTGNIGINLLLGKYPQENK